MKKFVHWKIEYSITLCAIIGIILILIPINFIKYKDVAFVSAWNDSFNKIEYSFNAMNAQANTGIMKGLKKSQDQDIKEQMMLTLIQKYLRIDSNEPITTPYQPIFLNGKKILKNDPYYFSKFYLLYSGKIVSFKDIQSSNKYNPIFIILYDMNGLKKPNQWGKDIYGINIFIDGKVTPIGSNWDLSRIKEDCSPFGTGVSCSYYYRIGGNFNE